MPVIKITPIEMRNVALGIYGHDIIKDDTEHVGEWGVIVVLEDTVFASATIQDTADYVDESFPQFAVIYGIITNIKLASGRIMAYKLR